MKKRSLIISIIFLILIALYWKNFWFLNVKLSEDFYIQQIPFTSNYVLKSKLNGKIVEHIYEWNISNNFIFGSDTYDNYFLYDIKSQVLEIYKDLNEFNDDLRKKNLIYRMDNCTRIMDFQKIN